MRDGLGDEKKIKRSARSDAAERREVSRFVSLCHCDSLLVFSSVSQRQHSWFMFKMGASASGLASGKPAR